MRLDNTEELRIRPRWATWSEVRELLDQGQARLAVVIPAGFAEGVQSATSHSRSRSSSMATNSMAASVTMSAASGVVGRFSADLAASHGLVVPEFIDFRTNMRFNPTMDFRDFTVPAQLGFITYQVTLAVAALGLARERELGTLEQLMVTPFRRLELTVGKGVPAVAIGGLNFAAMWAISLVVFDVPMNGSPLLLVALTLLFITAVVGWGVVDFVHLADAAAGHSVCLYPGHGGHDLFGVHGAGEEHARRVAGHLALCAAPALPGHRPQHHAQGRRAGGALAPGGALAAAEPGHGAGGTAQRGPAGGIERRRLQRLGGRFVASRSAFTAVWYCRYSLLAQPRARSTARCQPA